MRNKLFLSSVIIASAVVFFDSCKKKTEVDNETQSVVDNAICEQQFMAIQPVVNEKGITEKGIKRINSCETFSILSGDTTDANNDKVYDLGPVTFQIDYGTTGCVGSDGVYRTGKINITTAKKWSLYNNEVTVDLVGYKANTVSYTGTIKITRPDSLTITTEVINGHCSDGSWNIDYACTKTLKQIAGAATRNDSSDDEYSINGSSTGKNREGRNFTTSITNALIKKTSCKYISSGTLELTPDGFKTRTVDFGSGTCDDDATFTVNGQTVAFKLK
jgi:hypothetical protein